MTASKRLAAHRATASENPGDEEDDRPAEQELPPTDPANPEPKSKKKDKQMDEAEKAAFLAGAKTEGFKEANDRMNAVFASEHYVGNEKTAAKLLGKPALTAADIIETLADLPKVAPAAVDTDATRAAAEEAARTEMAKHLNADNKDLGSGGDAEPGNTAAKADSVWDRAREVNSKKGN